MRLLFIANVVAVLIATWAVWECRLTFRSRWDAPKTTALIFFALAATLDSPFAAVAAASFPLTGRYYLFMVLGHICYFVAAGFGIRYIYVRLLPDDAIGPFMRAPIAWAIGLASSLMLICWAASPLTRSMGADRLYLLRPDGWLAVYWAVYYVTLTSLLLIAGYGVHRLRRDPRSVMLNLMQTSLGLGALSCIASGVGILLGRNESVQLWAWPIAYGAIVAGSVAVVVAWRHRVQDMLGAPAS